MNKDKDTKEYIKCCPLCEPKSVREGIIGTPWCGKMGNCPCHKPFEKAEVDKPHTSTGCSCDKCIPQSSDWKKRELYEFELDKEAHLQGKCSFSSLALCSAEEQRIKMFFMDILNSLYKGVEDLNNFTAHDYMCNSNETTGVIRKRCPRCLLKDVLSLIDQYKNGTK